MNDLQELVLTIVSPLVTKPEEIQLDVVESEDFFEYNLTVAPEDIGRIIEIIRKRRREYVTSDCMDPIYFCFDLYL